MAPLFIASVHLLYSNSEQLVSFEVSDADHNQCTFNVLIIQHGQNKNVIFNNGKRSHLFSFAEKRIHCIAGKLQPAFSTSPAFNYKSNISFGLSALFPLANFHAG